MALPSLKNPLTQLQLALALAVVALSGVALAHPEPTHLDVYAPPTTVSTPRPVDVPAPAPATVPSSGPLSGKVLALTELQVQVPLPVGLEDLLYNTTPYPGGLRLHFFTDSVVNQDKASGGHECTASSDFLGQVTAIEFSSVTPGSTAQYGQLIANLKGYNFYYRAARAVCAVSPATRALEASQTQMLQSALAQAQPEVDAGGYPVDFNTFINSETARINRTCAVHQEAINTFVRDAYALVVYGCQSIYYAKVGGLWTQVYATGSANTQTMSCALADQYHYSFDVLPYCAGTGGQDLRNTNP